MLSPMSGISNEELFLRKHYQPASKSGLWVLPMEPAGRFGDPSKPCALILIKAFADIAPIIGGRIHLSDFVNNGSKIPEASNGSAALPIQPRDILPRASKQECALNPFERNVVGKERLGKLFVCWRKSEADTIASLQEHPNAFYVIIRLLGISCRSRDYIWPELLADFNYAASMLVGRESHLTNASLL